MLQTLYIKGFEAHLLLIPEKIFGRIKIVYTFAIPSNERLDGNEEKGSLAQLVQSICLTSRGSLVRIQ